MEITDNNEYLWSRLNNGFPQQIRLIIVSMSVIIHLSEWVLYCNVERDQHMLRNGISYVHLYGEVCLTLSAES